MRVPLGRGVRVGVLWVPDSVPTDRVIKPIESLIDESPLLSDDVLACLAWAADYYHAPLGDTVLAAFLPVCAKVRACAVRRFG